MSRKSREKRLGVGATRAPSKARGDVQDYLDAERDTRIGEDHAIMPELVRGSPRPRAVVLSSQSPIADTLVADLLDVIWGEVRGLKERQADTGSLSRVDREYVGRITDAATKILRERRLIDEAADEFAHMSEREIAEMFPPREREALLAMLEAGDDEDDAGEGEEERNE